MIIKNALVYTEDHKFEKKDVRIEDERIAEIAENGQITATDEDVIDGEGMYAIPGLVDIHFHGAVGYDFCQASKEELLKIAEYEAKNGVLAICPATMSYNEETQKILIKKIVGSTKENFYITAPFWCDYGYNIELGENFYSNHNMVILDCAKVKFGDNVFVAPNCGFYAAGHPVDYPRRNAGFEYAYPITVGDNVWIGGGVQVMPGVTIGSNVVIGGGSVVVKDIPSDCVAVGNPCKPIRKITDEDMKTCFDKSMNK